MAAAPGTEMKRTLTMTGLTINAMALIAPGAFLWTTFQAQVVQQNGGATTAFDMVPGLLFVLVLAFLTAFSYAELVEHLPGGRRGLVLLLRRGRLPAARRTDPLQVRPAGEVHRRLGLAPLLLDLPGHHGRLHGDAARVYILGLFGVALNTPLEIGAAVVFSAVVGLIAYRGISGSTMTAIVINAIQLTALVGFAVLAIAFRLTHPDLNYAHSGLGVGRAAAQLHQRHLPGHDRHPAPGRLRVGDGALGGEAINPKRDVRRAVLLSLAIQGGVAYVIEYVAANFFVNSGVTVAAAPPTATPRPLRRARRSATWSGTSATRCSAARASSLVIILAATVLVALIGTTLACLNTGVRITYVMGRDKEVPGILGMLHFRHATPHYGVIALTVISAILGGYAVLSADNLLQITLASNTGTFLVYGMTNAIVVCRLRRRAQAQPRQARHRAGARPGREPRDARRHRRT